MIWEGNAKMAEASGIGSSVPSREDSGAARFWIALGKKIAAGARIPDGYDSRRR